MKLLRLGAIKTGICTLFYSIVHSSRIALIMSTADVLMQHHNGVKEYKHINWMRTAKYGTIGFCFVGPILKFWSIIVGTNQNLCQSHLTRTLFKLFSDQIYLAPCLNFGIIVLWGALENESVREIEKRVSEYFPYIMKRHYKLWPAVQFFSRLCILPTLQICFENAVSILWYAYISGVLHKDESISKLHRK